MSETTSPEHGGLTTAAAATTLTTAAATAASATITSTTTTTTTAIIAPATSKLRLLLLPHALLAACILVLLCADFLLYRRRVLARAKNQREKREVQETYPAKRVAGGWRGNPPPCGLGATAPPRAPPPAAAVTATWRPRAADAASAKPAPLSAAGGRHQPGQGRGEGFGAVEARLKPAAPQTPLFFATAVEEEGGGDCAGIFQESGTESTSSPFTTESSLSPLRPAPASQPSLSSLLALPRPPPPSPPPKREPTPRLPFEIAVGKRHQEKTRQKTPHARSRKLSADAPDEAGPRKSEDSSSPKEVDFASAATHDTETLSAQPAHAASITAVEETTEDRRTVTRRNTHQSVRTTVMQPKPVNTVEEAGSENELTPNCIAHHEACLSLADPEGLGNRKTLKPRKKERKLLKRFGLQSRNELLSRPRSHNADTEESAAADDTAPSGCDVSVRPRECSSQRHLERQESQFSDTLPPISAVQPSGESVVCKTDDRVLSALIGVDDDNYDRGSLPDDNDGYVQIQEAQGDLCVAYEASRIM